MHARLRPLVVLVLAATLLLVAAPAWAHVGVEVDSARPGATAEYTVSVPNESDVATTDRVDIQLPEGLDVVETHAGGGGWTMTVEDGVLVIEGGRIPVGDRGEFRFTATNPPQPVELIFPTIQTYSDGEEVRWVGEEGSDNPAPRVVLRGEPVARGTEAEPPAPSPSPPPAAANPTAAPSAAVTVAATPTASVTEPAGDGDGGLNPLVVSLVALAGIIAAVVAVTRGRR